MADLVLRGGRVIDPESGRDDTADIAFGDGKLSGLDEPQLERVAQLLRPRFTLPNERIIRRGDCVFFIASPVLSR
jgi:hypothetical protein